MIKAATVLDITSSQEYHSMLKVKSTEVAHSLLTYNGIDGFTVRLLACLVAWEVPSFPEIGGFMLGSLTFLK